MAAVATVATVADAARAVSAARAAGTTRNGGRMAGVAGGPEAVPDGGSAAGAARAARASGAAGAVRAVRAAKAAHARARRASAASGSSVASKAKPSGGRSVLTRLSKVPLLYLDAFWRKMKTFSGAPCKNARRMVGGCGIAARRRGSRSTPRARAREGVSFVVTLCHFLRRASGADGEAVAATGAKAAGMMNALTPMRTHRWANCDKHRWRRRSGGRTRSGLLGLVRVGLARSLDALPP